VRTGHLRKIFHCIQSGRTDVGNATVINKTVAVIVKGTEKNMILRNTRSRSPDHIVRIAKRFNRSIAYSLPDHKERKSFEET